jgi:hypothetical protein
MTTIAHDLRARATDCLTRAMQAGPQRAAQLRGCAKQYRQRAIRIDLFEHGKQVGPHNVTVASFRRYLRDARA